jgi:plasmid maintenance system antidote protein VapI
MREQKKESTPKPRQPKPTVQPTPNQMLRAWIAASGRTVDDVAADIGMDRKQVSELMQGTASISHSTAHRLHRITGMRWEIWLK